MPYLDLKINIDNKKQQQKKIQFLYLMKLKQYYRQIYINNLIKTENSGKKLIIFNQESLTIISMDKIQLLQ